jgi:hypothetical protein
MKTTTVLAILTIASMGVASCAKSNSVDISVSPTKHDESQPLAASAVCPFIETQGKYELNVEQLKCTLSGRPTKADFGFVPLSYEIRSQPDGSGMLEMQMARGLGCRACRIGLRFPREPSPDDISYKGIECSSGFQEGHLVNSLSHPCPGRSTSCTITFTQYDSDFYIAMSRIQHDRTYSCHGKLVKLQ